MYTFRPGIALAVMVMAAWLSAAAPRACAGTAEDDYALAAGHYSQQRYDQAIADFQRFLNQHEGHVHAANARFFLAESFLQQGNYDQAIDEFTRFVETHPEHRFAAQAGFRLGESAYLQGKYDFARPKLAGFVAAHAGDKLCAFALPYLADCEAELGDLKVAQKTYELALKRFPAGPLAGECRLGLGRAAEELGQPAEARRFYQFLAEKDGHPLAAEARLRMGRSFYHDKNLGEATNYLKPLANERDPLPQRGAARYWLGRVHQDQQHADAAVAVWERAWKEDREQPLAPATGLALADVWQASSKVDEARAIYVDMLKQWPSSEFADDALAGQMDLALRAAQYNDVDKLAKQFIKQYAESPLLPRVRQTQGRALLRRGEYAQAIAIFEALGQEPSPERSQHQYALALAQVGAKQFDSVLKTLTAIDQTDLPRDMQAGMLATQATALVSLKRAEEALVALQSYVEQYPDGADIAKCRAQRCVAHVQLQQFNEALAAWQQYSKEHAKHPTLLPTTLYLAESAQVAKEWHAAEVWFDFLSQDSQPAEYQAKAKLGLKWAQQVAKSPTKPAEKLADAKQDLSGSDRASQAALARAQNSEKRGEGDDALAAYLDLLAKHPQSAQVPDALLAAARLHDERNQDREADVLLARLAEEFPDYAQLDVALYQWAWVLLDLDRELDAIQHLTRLHDDFPQSRFWADGTYRLAELKLRGKQYEAAQKLAAELLATEATEELHCHTLYLQGQIAVTQQKWNDVRAPLAKLVENHPRSELRLIADYWLAEADYRTGNLREAGVRLADLAQRLQDRKEPWGAMVPLRQAQVLAHEKRWEEAEKLAETIATRHPDFRQQYEVDYLLGRCLGAQAKFSAARDAYERVLRSPVGGKTETAAMAQWMIGETFFQQEKYADAISAYHRVERLFAYPRWQAAALLQAGKCHESQGEWREAIGLYAQVIKDHPKDSFAAEASQRLRVAQQRAAAPATRRE